MLLCCTPFYKIEILINFMKKKEEEEEEKKGQAGGILDGMCWDVRPIYTYTQYRKYNPCLLPLFLHLIISSSSSFFFYKIINLLVV